MSALTGLSGITGLSGLMKAVAALDPTQMEGLRGYWKSGEGVYTDTARTTPATTQNDLIASIDDQSGNGFHQQQGTSGDRPAWLPNETYSAFDLGASASHVDDLLVSLAVGADDLFDGFTTALTMYFTVYHPGSALQVIMQMTDSYIGARSGVLSLYLPPLTNFSAENQRTVNGGVNGVWVCGLKYDGSNVTLWCNGEKQTISATGDLALGTSLNIGRYNTGSGWTGEWQQIAVCKAAHTDPTMQTYLRAFHQDCALKYPARLIVVGDSLSIYDGTGVSGSDNWPQRWKDDETTAGRSWTHFNNSVGGRTLTDFSTNYAAEVTPDFFWLAGPNYGDDAPTDIYGDGTDHVVVVWGGTNDLKAGATGLTAYTRMSDYCTTLRTDRPRAKIVVATCIDRDDSVPVGFRTEVDDFNTRLVAGYTGFADAIVRLDQNANLGQAGDSANTTYFQSDKVHLTSTGINEVKTAMAAVIATVDPY